MTETTGAFDCARAQDNRRERSTRNLL